MATYAAKGQRNSGGGSTWDVTKDGTNLLVVTFLRAVGGDPVGGDWEADIIPPQVAGSGEGKLGAFQSAVAVAKPKASVAGVDWTAVEKALSDGGAFG